MTNYGGSLRYVYAGNRSGVLKEMLGLGLNVIHVLPVAHSWLSREVVDMALSWSAVESKRQAITEIDNLHFDIFVSCGFPFILPIAQLRMTHPDSQFVNIHPSPLPDLRGADPIPGAILFRRNSGVSCHLMDDGIDTGAVISQFPIPYHESVDARLLYHLCFQLEPLVFRNALQTSFRPLEIQPFCANPIYYSFQQTDVRCTESDSDEQLVARVLAFNTSRKGAVVTVDGEEIRVFRAEMLPEPLFHALPCGDANNEIVAVFEDSMMVRRPGGYCRLSGVIAKEPLSLLRKRIFS